MTRTRALIGDAACDDDSQCRTIAVGAKGCGGPEYYLAWSTRRTDTAALEAAAKDDAAAQRTRVTGPRMRSDCRWVTDPGAYCAAADGDTGSGATARSCRLRATTYGGPGGRVD